MLWLTIPRLRDRPWRHDLVPDGRDVDRADAEPGPGYTWYGGAMVTPAYTSGLWGPGDASVLEPPREDVGYWFPAGWQCRSRRG